MHFCAAWILFHSLVDHVHNNAWLGLEFSPPRAARIQKFYYFQFLFIFCSSGVRSMHAYPPASSFGPLPRVFFSAVVWLFAFLGRWGARAAFRQLLVVLFAYAGNLLVLLVFRCARPRGNSRKRRNIVGFSFRRLKFYCARSEGLTAATRVIKRARIALKSVTKIRRLFSPWHCAKNNRSVCWVSFFFRADVSIALLRSQFYSNRFAANRRHCQ